MRLLPSPPADDATFLRRVSLDLAGALPTAEEVRAFLADRSAEKRARRVDALLARPEFVDHWTYRMGDLLRINSRRLGAEGARAFHDWTREQVAKNTPFDRVARELLLGQGDSHVVGPANFARVAPDPRAQAELVAQLFMGVRLQCANCHKHPFDRWTQNDYHGLAAAFVRLERGREVRLLERGEVTHPRTGRDAPPTLPGGQPIPPTGDRRRAVADWLTDPANPYFARATVNRIWKEMMGRGLVEPVDDMRESNPPTNPELLAALAREFTTSGFDVRRLLRLIATSDAYQRSAVSLPENRDDDRFYPRFLPRPLPAPVLLDAVVAVTGVPEAFPGLNRGTRAIQLGDSRVASTALDLLGRCDRESAAAPSGEAAGDLARALHLLNGPTLNDRLRSPEGHVARWAASPLPESALVTEIYLSTLSRFPTRQERAHWSALLRGAQERRPVLEDFVWALLNSREFVFNH